AGVPGTGANEPIKSEVRSIGPAIEQMLSASGIASAIYPNTAAGLAATEDGQLFLVQGSGDDFAHLYLNDGGVAVDQDVSLPSSAFVEAVQAIAVEASQPFSFGNFIDRLRPFGSEASGGASLVGDNGVSIPANFSGVGSYVRPRWEKSFADYAGARTVIRLEVEKSAVFTRNLQSVFQVSTAGNPFATRMDSATTTISSVDEGDKIVFTFTYIVQGDETALQPYVTIAASADTTSNESFQISGIAFAFSEFEDAFSPARDQNVELLKSDILDRVSDKYQSGTGNIVGRLYEFGQAVANGASFVGEFKISVASGQTGAGSFVRPRWEKSFADYVGAEIELKLRVTKSATFTRQLVPTFQISTAANPFVVRAAILSTTNDGQETIYAYRYTIQGDEVALNPYVWINPGQTDPTGSIETFELDGFAVEFLSNPDRFATAADANIEMVKDEVASESRKITILRPTFVDTITVKASGGDFTTISDAIAAIRDASVRRQWKIAWSAGALLGTPDFHIPPFTAIVCQDRRDDAVLSFANPNGASGATIAATSLAWIDQDGIVIDGGTWRITNGRYVFHWETNGDFPDTKQSLINVVAEHLGNAGAGNAGWGIASQVALGIGVSGGQILDIESCSLKGPGGGMLAHSPANLDWTEPFDINVMQSRLEATDSGYDDIILKPIRHGPGRTTIRDCSFDSLSYTDAEWIGGDPGTGVNTAQIAVTASGNINLAGTAEPLFDNNIAFGAAAGASYTWFRPGK
ncbi:hypothetical protein, partial [Sphingobium yanoikuyae]|uniref:hypothetical protein n=1 Tax=Sphingobium yanoikuyae TaxID=13690 RepID=UPI000A8EED76